MVSPEPRNPAFADIAIFGCFLGGSAEKTERNLPKPVAREPPRAFKDMGGVQNGLISQSPVAASENGRSRRDRTQGVKERPAASLQHEAIC
jgi:hypothetical protein